MSDEEYLKNILHKQNPILFLGAGFSYGAKIQSGPPIPLGDEFKNILITNLLKVDEQDKEYKELNSQNLANLCEYITNEKSSAHLSDFLCNYFKGVQPANYHKSICRYTWQKIYTTNIDDLVEFSFQNSGKSLLVQNMKRKSTHPLKSSIEFIKLHGCVNNPSEGFTFSVSEYLASIRNGVDYRFSSLAIDMQSQTFIFIGTNFDEFNLDYYLKLYDESGYETSKGKLIFINPFPSIIFESKLRKLKGKLIQWDTERFCNFLNKVEYEDKDINQELKKKLRNFGFYNLTKKEDKQESLKTYTSKLYFGHHPTIKDILSDWDFKNTDIINNFNDFIQNLKGKSGVFSIYGKGVIGKSTFLLRLGVNLENQGFEAIIFKGRHFNFFELFKLMKENEEYSKVVLIVDNAAYSYKAIRQIIRLIPNEKQLIVLSASRFYPHLRFGANLVEIPNHQYFVKPNISLDYATNIAAKLEEKGFLGELRKLDSKEKIIRHISKENDVITVLYRITLGKNFETRILKTLPPLLRKQSPSKDILCLLAIFENLDLPFFPKELLRIYFGKVNTDELTNLEIFIRYNDSGDIRLRDRFIVTRVISSMSEDSIISYLKEILILISSQVDVKYPNYYTEISTAAMRAKSLQFGLKISFRKIKFFMLELKNYYSHNFNYWLQLGVAEQKLGEYDEALNRFKQAEALHKHSYMVKNAIGMNYLKRANSTKYYSKAKPFFKKGEEILNQLISKQTEYSAISYAINIYLNEKINHITKFKNSYQVTNAEIYQMNDYLEKLERIDPENKMLKLLRSKFTRFLKKINKLNLVREPIGDFKTLQSIFKEEKYEFDIEDMI